MRVVDRAVFERIKERLRLLYGERDLERLLNRLDLLVGRYGVGVCSPKEVENGLWDQKDAVLITYGDMVVADGEAPLATLDRFVRRNLGDAVSTVHLLPFFPYSSDDGFSVIDYRTVDPLLGTWDDIQALADHYDLMVDLVINHVSSQSVWFRNYGNGVAPERHFFIEVPAGTDLSAVVRPRTHPLLRAVQTPSGERFVWATFSHDQIDVDFSNPDVLFEYLDILLFYVYHGARIIRLDAIAYLWKQIGTPCIHLPQTHQIVKLFHDVLEMLAPRTILLTETNVPHDENVSYFGAGDEARMVYQFSLPPLLLHALETGDGQNLTAWLEQLEPPPPGCTYFNFTASHDGIGVRPLEGLLPDDAFLALVEALENKGGRVSRRSNPDGSEVPYELNITYYEALGFPGRRDCDLCVARFLCSQTIMLSLQGIPGIYFNSLITASNNLVGVQKTGQARTINRKKWTEAELESMLRDPNHPAYRVFPEYVRRLGIRGRQPAFHPDVPQQVLRLPSGLFGLKRSAPDEPQGVWVIANLKSEPAKLSTELIDPRFKHRTWHELILGWTLDGDKVGWLQLGPYEVQWLIGS